MKKDLELEIYLDNNDQPAVRLKEGDVKNGVPVAWETKFIEWSPEESGRFWAVVFKDATTPLKNGERVLSSKNGKSKKIGVGRPSVDEEEFTYGVFYQRQDGTVAYTDPRIMVRDAGGLRLKRFEAVASAAETAGLELEELTSIVANLARTQRELAESLQTLEGDEPDGSPPESP